MRIVYVTPHMKDDPFVHQVTQDRIKIAARQVVVTGELIKTRPDMLGAFRYQNYLNSLEDEIQDQFKSVILIQPNREVETENEILNGAYGGFRHWQDIHLATIRAQVIQAAKWDDGVLFHVDLGDCLSALYTAYYIAVSGLPLTVTFFSPPKSLDENVPRESFAVGGHSEYGKARPNIRRFYALAVLRKAQRVFVNEEGVGSCLDQLFPQFPQTYYGDPLTTVPSQDVAKVLSYIGEG
jgi:hypothetical protein